MALGTSAIFRHLITALPGSGGTPNNLGRPHPRWGFLDAHEKQVVAAGIRRDRGAPARAVSSSCGGLPGGAAGVRKNRGKKTAGVAGRRLRAPRGEGSSGPSLGRSNAVPPFPRSPSPSRTLHRPACAPFGPLPLRSPPAALRARTACPTRPRSISLAVRAIDCHGILVTMQPTVQAAASSGSYAGRTPGSAARHTSIKGARRWRSGYRRMRN